MHPLKKVESWVREVRSFLVPSHIAMYRRLARERKLLDPKSVHAPIALLDLRSLKADADAGRFVYLTYQRLRAAGYSVVFRDRFRSLANFQPRRYKRLLTGHPFHVVQDPNHLNGDGGLWITDYDLPAEARDARLGKSGWRHVRVSYDHRLPSSPNEIAHTFAMHPDVYEHNRLIPRDRSRSGDQRWCRILFAGNANERAYGKDRMGKGHPVLIRPAVVNVAIEAAGDASRSLSGAECETRDTAQGKVGFVAVNTSLSPINPGNWLKVLSRTDFFLAAPGASFPMSHNAVEAMHAGAVPILQYPQYFDPPLVDDVNCVVYRDSAELEAKIREIITWPPDRIEPLRRGAVEYYERHLTLEPLVRRLGETAELYGDAVWLFYSFVAPVMPKQ